MSSKENKSWPSVPETNLDAWKKSAQKSAPNGDVDSLGWKTPDGIHLKAPGTNVAVSPTGIGISVLGYKFLQLGNPNS